jgi:proteic killer suppression protein
MIISFANKMTELVAQGICPKGFQSQILALSRRKLGMLDSAISLEDLLIPPANRLEKLHGNLSGFYSIRINKQYRIIFQFQNGKAANVDIVDYH